MRSAGPQPPTAPACTACSSGPPNRKAWFSTCTATAARSIAGADAAATYTATALGYDVFLPDYRGYGKSGGRISSQAQLLADADTVHRQLLAEYPESRTVILGYSLGTGPATWLAARHHPKLLILQAPYFSMRDMAARLYPFVPGFLLRYPMPTNELIGRVGAPVVLFHGDHDEGLTAVSACGSRHCASLRTG